MSPFLVAPALAWLVAQAAKYLFLRRRGDVKGFRLVLGSGNMPSVHTAVVTALTVVMGAVEGLDSPLFALTFIFSAVVAYDAMQVRRATGELGAALSEMVTLAKLKLSKSPYQALGHRPLEVLAGALVGVVTAITVLAFL